MYQMKQAGQIMTALLIAGTDTDVGKTHVTIALAAYWQAYQLDKYAKNTQNLLTIFKLMQTGIGDEELYRELFAEATGTEVTVPLRFAAPLAPPLAAEKEGKSIELAQVWREFQTAQQKSNLVLLESVGGLGSPVTNELIVGNIAADWKLPTILVVPVKLGAIANAVANVALARSLKIDLRGIILSCSNRENLPRIKELAPIDLIQSLTRIPVVGTLPYIKEISDRQKLAQIAANWDLELILPNYKAV